MVERISETAKLPDTHSAAQTESRQKRKAPAGLPSPLDAKHRTAMKRGGAGGGVKTRDRSPGNPPTPNPSPRRAEGSPSARGGGGYSKKTIALVYDFDGTLSPKPMQEYSFLPKLGIKAADFWAECTRVSKAENADPLITYMHLMYKKAK